MNKQWLCRTPNSTMCMMIHLSHWMTDSRLLNRKCKAGLICNNYWSITSVLFIKLGLIWFNWFTHSFIVDNIYMENILLNINISNLVPLQVGLKTRSSKKCRYCRKFVVAPEIQKQEKVATYKVNNKLCYYMLSHCPYFRIKTIVRDLELNVLILTVNVSNATNNSFEISISSIDDDGQDESQ